MKKMSKAEKQAVFPTHSAPIPGSLLISVCVSSLNETEKSFFPEKRQKEDTPSRNINMCGTSLYIFMKGGLRCQG
jgi:hypothetical protein